MPKMGMGMVHVTTGMGKVGLHVRMGKEMATCSRVPQFPSVDSMRMRCNKKLISQTGMRMGGNGNKFW